MLVLEHPVLILRLEGVVSLQDGVVVRRYNYSVEQTVAFVHRSHLKRFS